MESHEIETLNKMTLDEYKAKYNQNYSSNSAKKLLAFLAATIGIIVSVCLILLVLRFFEINVYAGCASVVVAIAVFIFAYVVPLVKIYKLPYFQTNLRSVSLRDAKRSNRKARAQIADHMIELSTVTSDVDWYDIALITSLKSAREINDDKAVTATLAEIYAGSVKKVTSKMIHDRAIQIALLTATSASEKLDTLIVATLELSLVKDIMFLYGFRPSNAKLLRVFRTILMNSLVAYGASSFAQKVLGRGLEGIPVLGGLLAALATSATEAAVNGALTVVIGNQTVKYLREEYRLQQMIDGLVIDVANEDKLIAEIEYEIDKKQKNLKKPAN